jgi:Sodium:solute symporter family
MIGGLLAVVWTESFQTVLLAGAVVITVTAYLKIGGWHELSSALATMPHPLAGAAADIPNTTSNFLTMARGTGDLPGLPWYSILLGYPVIGIWYWCADQTIVQRVLAARDEKQARLGPLFCSSIKILPVFLFVLPGTICVALVQRNVFQGDAPKVAADLYVPHHTPAPRRSQGVGHGRDAGRCDANLFGGLELGRDARGLRHCQALASRNERSQVGNHRQCDHRNRHDPGHFVVAGRHSLLTAGQCSVKQTASGISVSVPAEQRQPVDTIVKLELDGPANSIQAIHPA